MKGWVVFVFLFHFFLHHYGIAQRNFLTLEDADSNYIRKHLLTNDLRLFYGAQGNSLSLGSKRDSNPDLNGDVYTNTNDYFGAGITYKWLDGDLSFSLPGTTYLKEERSNLTQIKLGLSYTMRKIAFRGYFQESKGVVIAGANNEYETTPSIHEARLGLQITYLFNAFKYSYRASLYQSEFQMKSAGSFMVRLEPFYRSLGGQGGSMIPVAWDVAARYGEQVGLEYVKAPGIVVLPGYGFNFAIPDTQWFISPMVFAGLGTAFNTYEGKNGKTNYTNIEYAASFNLNMGYNGSRYYSKVQFNWSAGYSPLNPSYFTSSNMMLSLWVGFRFRDVEKFFPGSL
jgi:hypothetical protein